MLEQYFPGDCTPWKGPMLQKFLKDYVTWECPQAGIGKEWEEEGETEELLWTDLPSGNKGGHGRMTTQGVEPGRKG